MICKKFLIKNEKQKLIQKIFNKNKIKNQYKKFFIKSENKKYCEKIFYKKEKIKKQYKNKIKKTIIKFL